MGMFFAVLTATILNGLGYLIFREPKEVGPGPLMSTYIFMTACFFLLWDVRLYPRSMRKLGLVPQWFIEFLIAQFLLEHLVIDFWFPLELGAINLLPKIADSIEEMMSQGGWSCDKVCETLKNEKAGYAISYIISTFFFFAVLHASRAIDLRVLQCGPGAFFGDIVSRLKVNVRRLGKKFGFFNKTIGKKRISFSSNKYDPCGDYGSCSSKKQIKESRKSGKKCCSEDSRFCPYQAFDDHEENGSCSEDYDICDDVTCYNK